ncbi:MAG: type II toxin-antitoxin system Phd/YefM family antitoxin [Acholeplasmataceae bacterium]|jgi:PHD/YefM family antitoxin component YafN of YafNO toxin-antitoxin module|nr:type II toxin-antitoxin system Phd/YefM family antitoxin [Erysipelotrichia bacterium]
MKIIIPSSDLRNKYNEISKLSLKEQRPIYITVNGRGDTVLLNQTVYETLIAELELLRLLAEADESVSKGDLIEAKSAFDKIRKELK